MARASKPLDVERAPLPPRDKEGALPIPAGAPKRRRAEPPSDVPTSAVAQSQPPVREEYPGPQTASTGEQVEPGRARPPRIKRR